MLMRPTHDHNGYLDVIISDSDRKPEAVTVDDLGLSLGPLLGNLVTRSVTTRPSLHREQPPFMEEFSNRHIHQQTSGIRVLQPTGTQNDADHMAERYNVVIKELLDELAPVSEFPVRELCRQP